MSARAFAAPAALFAALALVGCDRMAANQDAREKDAPNLVSEAEKANAQVIDATPQASMSAEERAQLRELARGYIDNAVERGGNEGFTAVTGVQDEVVALQPTQTHEYRIQLQRGAVYRIIGGCDNECSDFDLELLNPSGQIIERDTLPDDFPVINVTAPIDGQYRVRMTMKTCTIAPCYAAARLYRRGGAGAAGGGTTT